MADSNTDQNGTAKPQQVTSQTPATKQKNPKRVAAGKAIAERTRLAREAQKRALIEAQTIIAKNQQPPAVEPPAVEPPAFEPPAVEPPPKNVLTTTQWLSIISIVISLAGIYYKREEIKSVLAPKKTQVNTPPTPVVYRAPPRGIKPMD